jgi:hypothetical protein
MKPDKTFLQPDGRSLLFVECDVVDENGVMLPTAKNLVKFDITGNGMIVGVDNGKEESAELYKWGNIDKNSHSEREAYNGKVLVIVQSEKGTGGITLTASSDNLLPTILNIATEEGIAPSITHPNLGTAVSAQVKTINATAGVPTTLPKDVQVTYSSGIKLIKKVNWGQIAPASFAAIGSFTVNGVFADASVNIPAQITVNVAAPGARVNLALNTTAGNQDVVSATGPLATASFTAGTNYPNNMLNGNTTNNWYNWASQGASTLLPTINESRDFDFVEVYWPNEVTFNQVSLYFTLNANASMPKTINVQYWDGFDWINASHQGLVKASVTNSETRIVFDTVTAKRIRVGMENATPFNTTTGRIQITKFETYLNAGYELVAGAAGGDVVATLMNYTVDKITGCLAFAAYDSKGRLAWNKALDFDIAAAASDTVTVAVPDEYAGYSIKVFAWNEDFVPYTPAYIIP